MDGFGMPHISMILGDDRDNHVHVYDELVYVIDGVLELQIENDAFKMQEEDVIIIQAGQQHRIVFMRKNTLAVSIVLDIHQVYTNENLGMIAYNCNSVKDIYGSYAELQTCIRKLLNYRFLNEPKDMFMLNAQWYVLWNLLFNKFVENVELNAKDESGLELNKRKQYISNYIYMNYAKKITLNDLAQKMYLSSDYLSRYIRQEFGRGFMSYLMDVRLDYAVEDLLYTDKSMVQIALDNGFPGSASFNTQFKKKYGCTPSFYREKEKDKRRNRVEQQKKVVYALESKLPEIEKKKNGENQEYQEVLLDAFHSEGSCKMHKRLINVGEAKELLRSAMQKQLLHLCGRGGYQYVRFWNLLSEDMMISVEDIRQGKINFDMADRCTDFLVENGLKPYIELHNKPHILLLKPFETITYQEERDELDDEDVFAQLVFQYILHIGNRYGIKEIETWYFELWHRPALYRAVPENIINYFRLFEKVFSVIKTYAPNAKVGGAGLSYICDVDDVDHFLEMWAKEEYTPDYLTMYSYPYVCFPENGNWECSIDYNKDYMLQSVIKFRKAMKKAGFANKELHISEWSSSVANRNALNDSCFKGAYVVKNTLDILGLVDMTGYWMASDLFADYYDSISILNGGGGMFTKDGLPKPVCYAEEFLCSMEDGYLTKGENFAFIQNKTGWNILCYNYKHFGYRLKFVSENHIDMLGEDKLFEDLKERKLHFEIKNVKNGTYRIRIFSVNSKHGSVQDEVKKMELKNDLSKKDIEHLREICIPALKIKDCVVHDQLLTIETTMEPHEIQLIQIQYFL